MDELFMDQFGIIHNLPVGGQKPLFFGLDNVPIFPGDKIWIKSSYTETALYADSNGKIMCEDELGVTTLIDVEDLETFSKLRCRKKITILPWEAFREQVIIKNVNSEVFVLPRYMFSYSILDELVVFEHNKVALCQTEDGELVFTDDWISIKIDSQTVCGKIEMIGIIYDESRKRHVVNIKNIHGKCSKLIRE